MATALHRSTSRLLGACLLMTALSASSFAQVEVPTRDQIPDKYKWDLTTIYRDVAAWEKDFERAQAMIAELKQRKGTLGRSSAVLLETLTLRDETRGLVDKLAVYASQLSDENTADNAALALKNRATNLGVEFSQAVSWLEPELLAVPESDLRSWTDKEKGLAVYRQYFDNLIRQKKHILSPREEELLAMVGNLAAAPGEIFNVLSNAELTWPTVRDESGQEVQLSPARYNALIRSTDRRARREAFQGCMQAYGRVLNTFAAALNGAVQRNIYFARARGFESALDAALFPDNLPRSVYRNLVDTVNANLGSLHRWAGLRKRVLGLDELHVYDTLQPIVEGFSRRYEYDEAVRIVTEALEPLGPEYVGAMRQGFDSRWVDVYETRGKRSGAYSWGSYDTQPFILMNFNGTLDEVSTLAHEMGHSMHSLFSHRSQPRIYGDYATFVAEVASVTNEILLEDYLLARATDRRERAFLLNHAIDNLRGTLFRQVMFAEFEEQIHALAERGQPLTADSLGRLYVDIVHKYWGPLLVRDEEHRAYWARIPHFYYNFYVYKYATSYCAAAALAEGLLAGRPGALEAYLGFLKAGSSRYPIDILRDAGVDMTSPEPVQAAMRRFDRLVGQLEELLAARAD